MLQFTTTERYCLMAGHSLTVIIGVVGNAMIILTLSKKRCKVTSVPYLINLAMCDALSCINIIVFIIVVGNNGWPWDMKFCDFEAYIFTALETVEIWNFAFLALDRLVAVTKFGYLQFVHTPKWTLIIIISMWVGSFFLISAPFWGWSRIIYKPEILMCSFEVQSSTSYAVFTTIIIFFVPTTTAYSSYTLIIYKIWQYRKLTLKKKMVVVQNFEKQLNDEKIPDQNSRENTSGTSAADNTSLSIKVQLGESSRRLSSQDSYNELSSSHSVIVHRDCSGIDTNIPTCISNTYFTHRAHIHLPCYLKTMSVIMNFIDRGNFLESWYECSKIIDHYQNRCKSSNFRVSNARHVAKNKIVEDGICFCEENLREGRYPAVIIEDEEEDEQELHEAEDHTGLKVRTLKRCRRPYKRKLAHVSDWCPPFKRVKCLLQYKDHFINCLDKIRGVHQGNYQSYHCKRTIFVQPIACSPDDHRRDSTMSLVGTTIERRQQGGNLKRCPRFHLGNAQCYKGGDEILDCIQALNSSPKDFKEKNGKEVESTTRCKKGNGTRIEHVGANGQNIRCEAKHASTESRNTDQTPKERTLSPRDKRTMVMIGVALFMYSLCYFPTVFVLTVFELKQLPKSLLVIMFYLVFANHSANVFLYFLLNADFRSQLKLTLCSSCQRSNRGIAPMD